MHIQHISNRPNHNDLIYGTGAWGHGEVKDVPDTMAMKLLRHKDVFARPAQAPDPDGHPVQAITLAEPDKVDPLQDTYDKIAIYTKQQTRDFIKQQFNVDVDLRSYKTDASIRQYALMLVEQYGVT